MIERRVPRPPKATHKPKGYLVAIDRPGESIAIQFSLPDIGERRNGGFDEVEIVGYNDPKQQYVGGTLEISFTLDFFVTQRNRRDALQRARTLRSWTYGEGFRKPPSRVQLFYGSTFVNYIWVIKTLNINMTQFTRTGMRGAPNTMPESVKVEITLVPAPERDILPSAVRRLTKS
jgi:hypothetical protein